VSLEKVKGWICGTEGAITHQAAGPDNMIPTRGRSECWRTDSARRTAMHIRGEKVKGERWQ
jgi:hypothetical protein